MRDFDAVALFAALDGRRGEEGLSWKQVADEIWALSAELNRRRRDHPISPSTIIGMAKRRNTSCQHALFMLRWLGRAPESFVTGAPPDLGKPLSEPGPARRLRIRTARFATNMALAMRIVPWLDAAAADFVIVAKW